MAQGTISAVTFTKPTGWLYRVAGTFVWGEYNLGQLSMQAGDLFSVEDEIYTDAGLTTASGNTITLHNDVEGGTSNQTFTLDSTTGLTAGQAVWLRVQVWNVFSDSWVETAYSLNLSISLGGAIDDLPDVSSGAAEVLVIAAGADADLPDTATGAATVAITTSGAGVDLPDIGVGAATVSVSALGTTTDLAEVSTGSALVMVLGAAAIGDLPDIGAGAATAMATASGAITDLPDIGVGSGLALASGDGDLAGDIDISSGAGLVSVVLSGAVVDLPDVGLGSIGQNRVEADLYDAPDITSGSATVENIVAQIAVTDQVDVSAGAVVTPLSTSVALTDLSDTGAGSGTVGIALSATLTDLPDTSYGEVGPYGIVVELFDLPDISAGAGYLHTTPDYASVTPIIKKAMSGTLSTKAAMGHA